MKKFFRYTLGFIFLFIILASIALSKNVLFFVSIIFIFFAIREYRNMFLTKEIKIHQYIPELVAIACAYAFIFDFNEYITPIFVTGIFTCFLITIIKNKKPYLITTFGTIMGFLYTFCALYIVKLFYYFPNDNFKFILIYFLTVMLGDFSASRIGPIIKGKLLASEISPNKTVAGAMSNLVFSCLSGLLLIKFFNFTLLQALFFGITVSISSQIGDLSVSLIKRDLGVKDSSQLFLNYGGILDRVDAFIFSAPMAYYCLILINTL